jgi:predicted alpha/beta-hydrolase family hydrolase
MEPKRSHHVATSMILPISGYRNAPVPNRFRRPSEASASLAVLLPGFGYTLDMPLFYYAEKLLLDRGWDVLRVEYAYNQHPDYAGLAEHERLQWLLDDADAAFRDGLAQRSYTRVTLIGKSLGTLAMGHLLTTAIQPAADMRAVWLTPLLGHDRLREQILHFGGPSLFVIGTADSHFDQLVLDGLVRETCGEAVVVQDAGHGLDIPGDPVASVRAVEQVVAALVRFL